MGDLRIPDLNRVIIAGRLTRDPELRYTQGGLAFCRVCIANTRYFRKKDGTRGEEDMFVDFVVWDKQAEYVGERLRKGRPVLVEGRLKSDTWEDKATGQKRSKIEINAQRVVPLDWDADGPGASQRPAESRSSEPDPRPIEEPIPEDDIPF